MQRQIDPKWRILGDADLEKRYPPRFPPLRETRDTCVRKDGTDLFPEVLRSVTMSTGDLHFYIHTNTCINISTYPRKARPGKFIQGDSDKRVGCALMVGVNGSGTNGPEEATDYAEAGIHRRTGGGGGRP